jgi:hypothetical protein
MNAGTYAACCVALVLMRYQQGCDRIAQGYYRKDAANDLRKIESIGASGRRQQ